MEALPQVPETQGRRTRRAGPLLPHVHPPLLVCMHGGLRGGLKGTRWAKARALPAPGQPLLICFNSACSTECMQAVW
jgi:hypothetical protein